jgi:hypothetical protein
VAAVQSIVIVLVSAVLGAVIALAGEKFFGGKERR